MMALASQGHVSIHLHVDFKYVFFRFLERSMRVDGALQATVVDIE